MISHVDKNYGERVNDANLAATTTREDALGAGGGELRNAVAKALSEAKTVIHTMPRNDTRKALNEMWSAVTDLAAATARPVDTGSSAGDGDPAATTTLGAQGEPASSASPLSERCEAERLTWAASNGIERMSDEAIRAWREAWRVRGWSAIPAPVGSPEGESAGLRGDGWQSMWSTPAVGEWVETFGTLHRDGTAEQAFVRRSKLTGQGWYSPEVGSHEPLFWRALAPTTSAAGDGKGHTFTSTSADVDARERGDWTR